MRHLIIVVCVFVLGCGADQPTAITTEVFDSSTVRETAVEGDLDSEHDTETILDEVADTLSSDNIEDIEAALDSDEPEIGADVDTMPTDVGEEVDIVEGPPCGPRADGGYDDCDFEVSAGWRSTLCDESVGRCVAPEAHCKYGWCHIPARAFRSGAGEDSATIFAFSAAISRVGRAFFIGETELPHSEFERLMGYASPWQPACEDCPVASATYWEAVEVANRLSDEEGFERCYTLEGCRMEVYQPPIASPPGTIYMCDRAVFSGPDCSGYRLPSRIEWELAARGGSPLCLPRPLDPPLEYNCDTGPTQAEYAIWCGNADAGYRPCLYEGDEDHDGTTECLELSPLRRTRANDFGLHEVFGNVAEFTQSGWRDDNYNVATWPTASREPPFPIDAYAEFLESVAPSERVLIMGGTWRLSIRGICGHSTMPEPVIGLPAAQQNGFRLVRTDLAP